MEINNIPFSLFWLVIFMMLMLKKHSLGCWFLTYCYSFWSSPIFCVLPRQQGDVIRVLSVEIRQTCLLIEMFFNWGEEIQWITIGSNYKKVGYFWILRGKAKITRERVQQSKYYFHFGKLQPNEPFSKQCVSASKYETISTRPQNFIFRCVV